MTALTTKFIALKDFGSTLRADQCKLCPALAAKLCLGTILVIASITYARHGSP